MLPRIGEPRSATAHRRAARASRRAIQRGCSQMWPRNSSTVCAPRYAVTPVPTLSEVEAHDVAMLGEGGKGVAQLGVGHAVGLG